MREIKFRAKDYTGEWRYGYLIQGVDIENKPIKNFIIENTSEVNILNKGLLQKYYEIDFETLGQYTGLKDTNGKEIYEGDIIKMHYFFDNYDPTTFGVFEDESEITGEIVFDLDGFRVIDKDDEKRELPLSIIQEPVEELEVLGNIYDNPELLEAINED